MLVCELDMYVLLAVFAIFLALLYFQRILSVPIMSDNEDPYAVSSDSEDEETLKKPPPKINIEGRTVADIKQLKDALAEQKEVSVDDNLKEEIEALKAKKEELQKMKKEFEEGKIAQELDPEKKAQLEEERKELLAATKENYSKFKDRFEKMDETLGMNLEEKLKSMEKQLEGVGKETLASVKGRFENPQDEVAVERQELPDYQRSEADKKRILSTFSQKEMTADEAPKECAICGKTVYPVERIFANKQLYHNNCFKCHKCSKKLTSTNYNSHEGKLLCKVHMIEVFHPEIAQTMNPETTEEDEHGGNADEDDEFAVSSKPKQLSSDVVRSGTKVQDDLSKIGSLKDRKGDWESSVNEAMTVEKKTVIEEEIASGKVKANLDRFVSGAANAEEEGEEEEDGTRDPNIIREDKKKRREELDFKQVGDIKNKWKTGDVEGAELKEGAAKADLEELKQGVKVRDRFQERAAAEENVGKSYDSSLLDTSGVSPEQPVKAFLAYLRRRYSGKLSAQSAQAFRAAAEARKSFLEGKAYESGAVEKTGVDDIKFSELSSFKERFEKGDQSGPVEKAAVDVDVQLGSIKAQFEKSEEDMSPEERAELKKKEIEAEFLRYKLARKLQAKKAKEEAGEVVEGTEEGEVIEGAEVGSIKDRFEKGQASNVADAGRSQLDIEFKMAGKARDKFKEIDASGAAPVAPNLQKTAVRKYDTRKDVNVPEPVNRRVVEDDEEPEDEDFDVKNLMNKFKSIGEQSNVPKERKLEDLEGIKLESKGLKQRFEQVGQEGEDAEAAEIKKKILEEEFKRLKEEKEKAKEAEPEEEDETEMPTKEEIQVAADHASKMAAKWEKIQKKEAKRAQKSQMPTKAAKAFRFTPSPKCSVCNKTVYPAECFQCFSQNYHSGCFRCSVCSTSLRLDSCQQVGSQLYCRTHHKRVVIDKQPVAIACDENGNFPKIGEQVAA